MLRGHGASALLPLQTAPQGCKSEAVTDWLGQLRLTSLHLPCAVFLPQDALLFRPKVRMQRRMLSRLKVGKR